MEFAGYWNEYQFIIMWLKTYYYNAKDILYYNGAMPTFNIFIQFILYKKYEYISIYFNFIPSYALI